MMKWPFGYFHQAFMKFLFKIESMGCQGKLKRYHKKQEEENIAKTQADDTSDVVLGSDDIPDGILNPGYLAGSHKNNNDESSRKGTGDQGDDPHPDKFPRNCQEGKNNKGDQYRVLQYLIHLKLHLIPSSHFVIKVSPMNGAGIIPVDSDYVQTFLRVGEKVRVLCNNRRHFSGIFPSISMVVITVYLLHPVKYYDTVLPRI
jgi:hypothetical protein